MFRPWPIYTRQVVHLGPRSCYVEGVQPLTADGFRPWLMVVVVYSISEPDAFSMRHEPSGIISALARSAYTRFVGEVTLAAFVSRQAKVSEQVAASLQKRLDEWGLEIRSVEVIQVGRIAFSSARAVLGADSGAESNAESTRLIERGGETHIVRAM